MLCMEYSYKLTVRATLFAGVFYFEGGSAGEYSFVVFHV